MFWFDACGLTFTVLPPLHSGKGQYCPCLAPFTAVRAGVTLIPYGQTGRCSFVAGLVDKTLLIAVVLLSC